MSEYLNPENIGRDIVHIAAHPYRAIADYAEEGKYDLVVMATLGEHESNFLIGSVAEKVIRYSTVPVLSTFTSTLGGINNILLPTEGSPNSFKALSAAVSLALAFGASINLYYVQHSSGKNIEQRNPYEPDTTEIKATIFTEFKEKATHLFEDAELRKGENFSCQLLFRGGKEDRAIDFKITTEKAISSHRAITAYAKQTSDLVVMTTHGYTGLDRMFIGSTAENVVRHIKLPILTVRPGFVA